LVEQRVLLKIVVTVEAVCVVDVEETQEDRRGNMVALVER